MRRASEPRQPKSYGDVARAMSSWTTKGILTALVLVAGLGFGRQVLRWWRQGGEPPSASPGAGEPSARVRDTGPDHVLRFGEQPWSLRTTWVVGDRDAAAAALRTACRGVASQARLPDEPPDEAERALLKRLAPTEPSGARRRVVTWGLAVPRAANEWSIYTFQPDRPGGSTAAGLPRVPLPPDARRTLAVETAGSGAIVAFEGPGLPGAWKRFYDDWLTGGRFQPVAAWHDSPQSWHLRCRGEGEHAGFWLDVHVTVGTSGETTGLIVITPGAEGAPQGDG